jgi:DNA-binding NarL/FixJ family response regulator
MTAQSRGSVVTTPACPRTTRQVQPCGTRGAYLRHIRAAEPTCDDCKAAHREYTRTWRVTGRSRDELDEVAVERAIHGEPPDRLTIAEREAVVRHFHHRGLSDGRIAEHLDIGRNGVQGIRQRLGLPAIPAGRRAAA